MYGVAPRAGPGAGVGGFAQAVAVEEFRLANGMRVLMYAEPASPVFEARVVFPAGSLDEGAGPFRAVLLLHRAVISCSIQGSHTSTRVSTPPLSQSDASYAWLVMPTTTFLPSSVT